MVRKIFASLAVILFVTGSAWAATRTPVVTPVRKPVPVVPTKVEEPIASAEVTALAAEAANSSAEMTISDTGEVSLDFRDADIQNVLKILSYKSGVNIVTGPEVTGVVTIKLGNVPWKQALDVILQTYGYASEQRGNVIVVTTIDNMKKRREDVVALAEQEVLQTRTVILNYAKATEIIASIEKMKGPRGSVNFDERTNTVIIRDTATNLDLMEQVVKKLDTVTPQVLIEAKIVETDLNNERDLGITWNIQASASGMKRPTVFPFYNRTSPSPFIPDAIPIAPTDTTALTSPYSFGTLDASALQAVLKMLESRTDTNILSNPRIVTLDNQPAKIEVGNDRPIPNYTYNEQRGTFDVNGFTWRTIGILFAVTPHVNSAGFVTLDLAPEVSEENGKVTFSSGGGSIDLPIVGKKTATTRVMVKDGDTLVIGGLIKDTTTVTKHKVPLLGDIPLLGLIFQSKENTIVKQDLLIFLTPHIITVDPSLKKGTR